MKTLRKTKIVGTIGPASENRLEELINAGLNVTRINYSHGSWDEQSEKTEEIIRLRKELNVPVALLLDMQGPEIRTGMLVTGKNEKIKLEDGQKFTLVNEDIVGDKDKVSVSYKGLYNDVKPGSKVLIDDGAIELVVDEIVGKDIVCTVVHGNGLGSRKTINLPGTAVRLPALKEKDIQDLKTACEHDYDYVAMSFTRNKDDIDQVRKVLDENGGKDIKIITKVENVEGLEHMEEIVENADVQMIARGDMATETDFTEPPVAQKKFIKLSNRANKPAITATQMLESMTFNPLPTRAEASDVANAIFDRTSAVMLSGECAMGKYPVECVKTMVKIAGRVEPEIDYWKRFKNNDNINLSDFETKIAYSTCVTAMNMEADAIVCYTHSGDSARKLVETARDKVSDFQAMHFSSINGEIKEIPAEYKCENLFKLELKTSSISGDKSVFEGHSENEVSVFEKWVDENAAEYLSEDERNTLKEQIDKMVAAVDDLNAREGYRGTSFESVFLLSASEAGLNKINKMYIPEQLQTGFQNMIDEYVHFNESARNSIMERMTPDYMVIGIRSKTETYKYKSEIISDEKNFYTNEKTEMTGLCDKFLSDEIDKDSFYDGLKGYLNHYYENRYELRNQPGSVREKSNDMLDKLQHMFGV